MAWIAAADEVACCRIGFVEVYRAIARAGAIDNLGVLAALERDWAVMRVVDVDDHLVRGAAVLATTLGLRTLDALHLAAAETLVGPDLRVLTWDIRLWRAARARGLATLPETEP